MSRRNVSFTVSQPCAESTPAPEDGVSASGPEVSESSRASIPAHTRAALPAAFLEIASTWPPIHVDGQGRVMRVHAPADAAMLRRLSRAASRPDVDPASRAHGARVAEPSEAGAWLASIPGVLPYAPRARTQLATSSREEQELLAWAPMLMHVTVSEGIESKFMIVGSGPASRPEMPAVRNEAGRAACPLDGTVTGAIGLSHPRP